MEHVFRPRGVCSHEMRVEIEDGIIRKVAVKGGCSGNLQGISKLLVGMDAREAISRMRGIRCGFKPHPAPISSQKPSRSASKKLQIDLHNISK